MTQERIATPILNYSESEDLIFEIGDEEPTTTKKSANDDRVGYGHEVEPDEESDIVEEDDDILDEFSDFDWDDEEEPAE
ncbi:MAG: hypothetical protein ACD_81C00052G0001 [uncultured bacterium]|uniref:Uncharacterized protein n=2 Tax=Candidatus Wolfeibacteriota TaxID=1752735 RepID=A0A0G1K6F5_9BACT|nr:MAG: hypothetical protein ACD_81C00052G0001 [uncultured bacterium]KKR12482.1 MAG: hypothetical protein UT41_C0001G0026 [Candidatus Wolfebacteria bacterium GW2011_GWC2_39_22]KKT43439.1 MAG: hypothetical protein UW32_C0001G0031 [Candidatus Wolfebacteria bacterium GW2011_GWE2_44_13]HBI25839.1 hypothetical protein [Candidatus Wolfebacteria bacterium]